MSADLLASLTLADKAELHACLLDELRAQLSGVTETQRATQRGATHEEARPENDKDTRAIEGTYLARGLAERVAKLEAAVAALAGLKPRVFGADDPAALGALISVVDDDSGARARYYLVPDGGGEALSFQGEKVQSVSTKSPLGAALVGKYVDEDVELRTPKGRRTLLIEGVR